MDCGTEHDGAKKAMVGSCTNRSSVYLKGAHDVALCDGICDCAIQSFIQIQRIDGDKDGIECAGAFVKSDLILLLLENWGIVILIQDGYIYSSGSLWANTSYTWNHAREKEPDVTQHFKVSLYCYITLTLKGTSHIKI